MDNQFGTGFQKARPELVYLGGDNVDNFAKMFQLQMMLFLLMAVGVIFRKRNIISESGRKTLSNLTVNLILPCNIIESFLGEWNVSENLLRHCLVALGISLGIQVAALYLSMLFFAPVSRDKKNIFKYGLIVSNSSFIGIPVVGELYGNLGVLYTSFFQIPIRIMMWTSGLSLFTNVDKKESFQKLIKHPCIIAIVIGAFLMIAFCSAAIVSGKYNCWLEQMYDTTVHDHCGSNVRKFKMERFSGSVYFVLLFDSPDCIPGNCLWCSPSSWYRSGTGKCCCFVKCDADGSNNSNSCR